MRAWTSLRDWATASPANFGSASVVAVLALSLPFGGWREAEADPLTRQEPGTEITAAPFEVTVVRAVHATDLGGYLTEPYTPGARHVVVELILRNTSDETLMLSDVRRALSVQGLPVAEDEEETAARLEELGFGGEGSEGVDDAGDVETETDTGTEEVVGWTDFYDMEGEPGLLSGVVPGMDYHLGLHEIVEVPAGQLPEEVTVRLSTLTYRQMSITDQFIWTDPVPTAEVVVPLEEAGAP